MTNYVSCSYKVNDKLYACDICESVTYITEISNVTPVFSTVAND